MSPCRLGLFVVGAVAVAGCASAAEPVIVTSQVAPSTTALALDDSTTTSTTPATLPATDDTASVVDVPALEWQMAGGGIEEAYMPVPLDYDDPTGEMIDIYVARFPARDPDQRIGSLLVNPGGPGFGGSDLAFYADQIYDSALLDVFDVIGWDPRGTGWSTPTIDCIDDYDPYFAEIDITPEDQGERNDLVARAQEFADLCVSENPGLWSKVGTNNSARDIDWLRRALGENTITYFGFSYGSELGATWATMFPETVRAAVLDGAADPDADSLESSLQQLEGFENSLTTFLARCSSRQACAFHNGGDAEGAFDDLMVSLDDDPVPTSPGRPAANLAVAINGVIEAMYSEYYWPQLENALASAANGDGRGLLALHDSYFQRQNDGSYGNELEAFQTISCADSDERASVDEENELVEAYRAVAPRLVPEGSSGSYFCTFFPTAGDPRVEITGAGAGPIVVIGTTGDPATPLESTRAMADTLEDGRLVVVEADQHTGYGLNQCVIDVVNDYLIDLTPPADDTECD
ncbi:MAG: alpha/beta hydrolase [Ilumatobacteraceae bacterium]